MKKTNSKVQFHFIGQKHFFFPNRRKLKSFIELLFKKERKKLLHVSYVFCSDEFLLKINQEYLNHDYYTDIVTFDLSETYQIVGEIYISIDRVKDNAKTFNSSFFEELHRVIFHGALHLSGYADKTINEKARMTKKENFYLQKFFA
ncbi:MAG TPA: rRNA maturation RNase YbeY [Puia sp.]|nr:rRNA maturation RNase YbeY [Puia sp.]